MIANFFNKTSNSNSIILFCVFIVVFCLSVYLNIVDFSWSTLPLFTLLILIFNFIVFKNKLTYSNSYSFLFFVILIGFFPQVLVVNKIFFTSILLTLSYRRIFNLRTEKNIQSKIFDSAFFIGSAGVIEPFSVIFYIMLGLGVFMFNRFSIKALVLSVFGLIAPFIMYFSYVNYSGETHKFYNLFYWYPNYNYDFYLVPYFMYCFGLVCVFLLVSVIIKSYRLVNLMNSFKVKWLLLIVCLFLSFLLVLLSDSKDGNELLYIFFPSAIIFANGVEELNRVNNSYLDGIIILFIISMTIPFLVK